MCTVSFFRIAPDHFILTSNRDEKILRETSPPILESRNDLQLIFPKDLEKGGSWIAAAENGRIACLLNGAFEPHVRNPPYRKSRGMVLLESFDFNDIQDFFKQYDFENIEPFTLIIAFFENKNIRLFENRWDGKTIHVTEMNPSQPHMWCSTTLYTKNMRIQRTDYFRNWIRNNLPGNKNILRLHSSEETGAGPGILMQGRYGLQTVSITQLEVTLKDVSMLYLDRLRGIEKKVKLDIR